MENIKHDWQFQVVSPGGIAWLFRHCRVCGRVETTEHVHEKDEIGKDLGSVRKWTLFVQETREDHMKCVFNDRPSHIW